VWACGLLLRLLVPQACMLCELQGAEPLGAHEGACARSIWVPTKGGRLCLADDERVFDFGGSSMIRDHGVASIRCRR
jgi:hypothetical protein